jgi:hypothetical protein
MRKEARSRREVIDTSDVFITTMVESQGLIAPETVPRPLETASLLGEIELSVEENLLGNAQY